MKKYLFALASLMMMGLHVQAQKFLDFYYQGSVVSSVNASDIDSMVIGTNPTNRTVDLYKNGDIFHSTTAARVDSVKVFKPENAPLVYLGIIGFNQELYKKEFGILSTSTASGFKTFVGNLTCKDGTLLYYGVDKALDMLKSTSFPTQVNSVNLITFTDGLDQGSMMMNGSYITDEQYLNAVHQLIVNTRVKGLPLTAYSLGLKGSDVTNYTLFQNNLTKLASSSDKAIEVSSMSAVRTRLQEISDQIISISNKQTVSMKIPGPSNGTIIRFTFDNATAANSSMYIEGTFNLSDRSLRNVKYYGIKGGSGTIVQGKQEGIFVTYTFSGLQRTDGNGLIPVNSIREFYRSSTTNTWQENSEFTPANNTQTNITHSGAIILLVLDCSSSLGSQFSNMKSYAQDFITRVANNAEPYEFLAPTNVKAELEVKDDNFVVNVSWNAVKYAESYNVYRSNSSNGTYELVAENIPSTTWTDLTPVYGNSYYYKVCAKNGNEASSQSSYSSVNVSLAAPTNVKAEIDENDLVVNVSWDAVKYAQSYKVYRSSSSSGTYSLVAEGITSTTWTDDSPLEGYNYYKVCAEGYGFTSSQSSYDYVDVSLAYPTNVKAVIDENDLVVNVSWDAVKYAQSYKVYRSSSSRGTYSLVAEGVTSTTWKDSTPEKGYNYYKVCAFGHGFTSSQSSYSSVNVSLAAPTNVKAEIDENDLVVNVSWDAVKYAQSYKVYRSSSSNGTYELVAEGVTSTTWKDSSPLSGSNYYKVCAVNRNIISSQSSYSYVNVSLAAPTNVAAEIDENDLVVNVSWDAVKYAQSYKVYRSSSSSGTYSLVAEGVTSTTWTDSSPLSGSNYYKVCAVNRKITSAQSSYTSVTVNLAAPTNVKAVIDENDLVVNVSWDAVKYAQSYKVYHSSSSSGTYSLVAEGVTSTTWKDSSPLSGSNYYKVCAVNRKITSAQSSYTSVTVNLAAPTNVKAVIDENDLVVNVSWDAVKYAQSYKVYHSSSSSGTYSLVAEGVTSTTWTDSSPLSGSNYYKVCAVGYGITSSKSSYASVKVSLALSTPTNIKAEVDVKDDNFAVNVSWDAVKYAQSYNVYRCSSPSGTYSLIAERVTSTSWTDNNPISGNNYYKVNAQYKDIVSDFSNAVRALVLTKGSIITANGVAFNMVKVSGGTFQMGATSEQGSDAESNEKPVHQVTLSDYYIGETEVTQELWQAVMGSNPSYFTGSGLLPVEKVSWDDCQTFITNLNVLTGMQFRLPTEAEWEFAARGGNSSQGYKYSGSNNIDDVAWYYNNSNSKTHEVGTKAPNELGLYDMSGNVYEWCQDWYGSYSSSAQTNPTGPTSGSNRVNRGGCWGSYSRRCRVSYRDYKTPVTRYDDHGLRLAL